MARDPESSAGTESRAAAGTIPPRRIDSIALFRDDREIIIVHRGREYRLRITRADKLLLTK
jgi:hemin uptake protein HemP